ncbi:MAG: PAS domain-containing protein [Alphaproteobacteria bacterium]|nr:PAS domain-containing protein [Alphaproteobacteria bacterium]
MTDVIFDSTNRRFAWPKIASEPVRALATHWSILAKNGQAPLRERFTPLDLPARSWKNLFLLDFHAQSREFIVRVHGTYLVEATGADFTGLRMNESEIPGCTRRALFGLLQRIAADGAPQYYKGETLFRPPNWMRNVEQALCPLADEDGRLAAVIGAAEFAPMGKPAEAALAEL